ncbi:MAG: retropepsin-like domain-containing protein [Candidatus Cloacimonetes bacterium]|nr:retropepsin-like domain-containing protein [Candidatus Cloacimonadota bacterium]
MNILSKIIVFIITSLYKFRVWYFKLKMFLIKRFKKNYKQTTHSERLEECKRIVDLAFQAIKNKSPKLLTPHLAIDFTMFKQQEPIASMALSSFIQQFDEEIDSFLVVNDTLNKRILTLNCELNVINPLKTRFIVFRFNEDCQIKEIELVGARAKIIKHEDDGNRLVFDKPAEKIISIPFELKGDLIFVSATINGEKKPFIIDTGAPNLLLNNKYFEKPSNLFMGGETQSATGTVSDMAYFHVSDFNFGEIKLHSQDVMTANITHLEDFIGTEAYGLIGYGVFKDYDVLLDYENRVITLLNPEVSNNFLEKNYPNNAFDKVPIEMNGHLAKIRGTIGKMELDFKIDTGATVNSLNESIINDLIEQIVVDEETDTLYGLAKETIEIKKGYVKELTIGNKAFYDLKTIFEANLVKNVDNVIGYEILKQQKCLISYVDKYMVFVGSNLGGIFSHSSI